MTDLIFKTLTCFFIVTFISLLSSLLNSGKNNQKIFYCGLFAFLLGLGIFLYGSKKNYDANDYSSQKISAKSCSLDEANNAEIITDENKSYKISKSIIQKGEPKFEFAESICRYKDLRIWLNPDNQISGLENEQMTIPVEVGINEDKLIYRLLLSGAIFFGFTGLFLMAEALWYDRKGLVIDLNTGRARKKY